MRAKSDFLYAFCAKPAVALLDLVLHRRPRGARRTAMWIDPQNGLALVILVERFDMPGGQQQELYGSIMKSAVAKFGRPQPATPTQR